ncbi:globin family protein [Roseiconus lacunae]|uniref:Globin family protein n=1 Tax=Roseiconus lacunae TaxID=2605694 RepID=A0ABT7PEF2_9BACT|nr:globin family protein [Roseiconus lacunae]MCD0462885.1 globin domain-containing protein [Roseiconus lacunae]MDM4014877.1 globin family protein [Roseiconus lacunae]WRQ50466.1 globin family protein [Stieleria sp. HD01]
MTPEKIALVQSSWEKVKPISEQAAELFYGRLFELDPSLKVLFKGDMKEQGKKLMATLNLAVVSLTKLEDILPAVKDLGRRHVQYGVPDESYQTVGEALLWTLGKGLGDDFTPEVEAAWTETYVTLSTVMLEAAHEGDQPVSVAG